MSAVTLTRIEAGKNMRRFYRLDVQPLSLIHISEPTRPY